MPSLDAIVSEINDRIKATLGGPVFGLGKYYGLAVSLPRNSIDGTDYMPCVVTNYDEDIWVGINDTAPLIIYHKNNGIVTDFDKRRNWGRTQTAMIETASFQMIVFGDRKRLEISPEELYAAIVSAIPTELPKDFITPLNFREARISGISPNFNSISVYQQEYKSNTYPLKPNNIFFSISYKIATAYNKNCVALC
jgi:hypothetical protein